jgi:hypothetical protein
MRSSKESSKKDLTWLWALPVLICVILIGNFAPVLAIVIGAVFILVAVLYWVPDIQVTYHRFLRITPDRPLMRIAKIGGIGVLGVLTLVIALGAWQSKQRAIAIEQRRIAEATEKADQQAFEERQVAARVAEAQQAMQSSDWQRAASLLNEALKLNVPGNRVARELLTNLSAAMDEQAIIQRMVGASAEQFASLEAGRQVTLLFTGDEFTTKLAHENARKNLSKITAAREEVARKAAEAEAEAKRQADEIRAQAEKEAKAKADAIAAEKAATHARFNKPEREAIEVGDFQFKVLESKWNHDIRISQLLVYRPDAYFLLVKLTAVQNGQEAQRLPTLQLVDAENRQYVPSVILDSNYISLRQVMNPGVWKTGWLAFDVPHGRTYRLMIVRDGIVVDVPYFVHLKPQ